MTKDNSPDCSGEAAITAPSTSFNDWAPVFCTPCVVAMCKILRIGHMAIYYTVPEKVCFVNHGDPTIYRDLEPRGY